MKRLFTILITVLFTAVAFAQAPQKMSYQAVIRNSSNALVTTTPIGMKISILQGSESGTAVYVETQAPTTNANGLVTIQIGGGTPVTGTFAGIDWSAGPYFIKTETATAAPLTTYTITGVSQLLSVPYALHAQTVAGYTETDPLFVAHPANGISAANITDWNTSFTWGDHAGLYRPVGYVPAWGDITSNPFSITSVANNQLLKYNSTTSKWENWTPNFSGGSIEIDPVFVDWDKSTGISITASQVSNFTASVNTNAAVAANTAKNSYPTTDQTKLAAITGTNTGDETTATIKSKLAITTLSGSNTGDQTLSALGGVASNTAITGATNTKITYDVKGLVTAGTAATTADIAASTNKNYVTDAQQTIIGNTTGTNTGDQTNIAGTAANVTGIVLGANGGTGIANTGKTLTLGGNLITSGAFSTTLTSIATTAVTLPTTGTLVTLAGTEALTNKTINGLTPTALTVGFTLAGGTTPKTLTVPLDATVSGTNTGDQTNITGSAGSFTGSLAGEVTGPQGTTVIDHTAVLAIELTGYASATGTVTATDNIKTAIQKLDGNIKALPASGTHYLGEEFGGGIVFNIYKDVNGVEKGLIVDYTQSSTSLQWSTTVTPTANTTATSTWNGDANTTALNSAEYPAAYYAATLSSNGFSDWYLPSIDELNLLYNNRYHVNKALTIKGSGTLLGNGSYWSSTDYNASDFSMALLFFFGEASSYDYAKTLTEFVRVIRAF
ncbi:MAG: DUF1566 domain-containing protein [Bacteroidota bacterium]